MIVVDSSAVLAVLLPWAPKERMLARLADDGDLHAPHLIDIEILHALRRLVRLKKLSVDGVGALRRELAELAITRYPHEPLADRIWDLRHNLSAYDAAFVALAEALAVALVTVDGRLARARGHEASVELF